ncbi:hypothetical protein Golax_014860 [Gossypium laxum]|uniref:RNase H type-1 domain-containing protein n=1 Tax=Gossypium laxum TaxID=34288 RepID=A0A7J8ZWD7_9ROSI|nr:hypothetical protein [Gossypium laxum]
MWANEVSNASLQYRLLFLFTMSTSDMRCGSFGMSEIEDAVNERLPGRLIDVEQWRPQDAPYVKVNFDTAFRASENISYAGIFIRDHLGLVLGYQSVLSKHVPSPFTAEGLLPCSSTGSEARVPVGPYISDINTMVVQLRGCHIVHIPRITNQVAHLLASAHLMDRGSVYQSWAEPLFILAAVYHNRGSCSLFVHFLDVIAGFLDFCGHRNYSSRFISDGIPSEYAFLFGGFG